MSWGDGCMLNKPWGCSSPYSVSLPHTPEKMGRKNLTHHTIIPATKWYPQLPETSLIYSHLQTSSRSGLHSSKMAAACGEDDGSEGSQLASKETVRSLPNSPLSSPYKTPTKKSKYNHFGGPLPHTCHPFMTCSNGRGYLKILSCFLL